MKFRTDLLLSVLIMSISGAGLSQAKETKHKPCIECSSLIDIHLPDVKILEAAVENSESSYCKILGVISSEINFELLLPLEWNERFVMGGGGGFVGDIQNMARSAVHEGYATSGTDTGHKGIGIKADWALYNMDRLVNFGHVAVHRTAEVSKSIQNQYYCKFPEYSYFVGCSRGGGQALIEAQRYPDDFDGIVAGAPIINWIKTGVEFIQNTKVLFPDSEHPDQTVLPKDKLPFLQSAILERCDNLDGVNDQIIHDPRECSFDFESLPICPQGQQDDSCFSMEQIEALKLVYGGVSNTRGTIYPGFPVGGENEPNGIYPWIVGPDPGLMALGFPSLQYAFGTEMFKYFVFHDPDWDYTRAELDHLDRDGQIAGSILNVPSSDYRRFNESGGKLIIYHGWNDFALSAYTSIEHFEEALKSDDSARDYIRLYLLPGILHCSGGPGPGQANWIEIMRKWVEQSIPPGKVIMTKTEGEKTIMSRPVFPYPAKAVYNGKGDPNVESSYLKNGN